MIYTRILPITQSAIDWESYLQHTQSHLGRSVTASLDGKNSFAYDMRSFLYTMGEFSKAGTQTLFDPILRHVHFTFLIIGTESLFLELMSYGLKLTLSEMRTLALTSADLFTWKTALQSGCNQQASYSCRVMSNEIVTYFKSIGLAEVFSDYKVLEQKDKTFLLERK